MQQARHITDEQPHAFKQSWQSQPTKHKRPTDQLQHMHQARHITDEQPHAFKQSWQSQPTKHKRPTDQLQHMHRQAHNRRTAACIQAIMAVATNQAQATDRPTPAHASSQAHNRRTAACIQAIMAVATNCKHKRPTDQLQHMHQARHMTDEQAQAVQASSHNQPSTTVLAWNLGFFCRLIIWSLCKLWHCGVYVNALLCLWGTD